MSFSSVSCVRDKRLLGSTVLPVQAQGEKSSEFNLGLGKEGRLGAVFPRLTLALDLE